jgi:hypothetical protein
MSRLIRLDRLRTGVVLSTPKWPFDHYVLISDNRSGGILRVISTSPGTNGVAEIPCWQFSSRQLVRVHGYLGELPPEEVMGRARSLIGMRYDVGSANCEHFVRWCHGLEPESPTVRTWLTVGALVAGGLLLAKAA